MHRIDSSGAVVALETPASVGATVGYFSAGNPGTGTQATIVSSDWLNSVQEEIMTILTAAGYSADKTVQNQLWKSIKTMGNRGDVKVVTSADYTVLDTDFYKTILVSTGASDRTITLPLAANNTGRKLYLKKTDTGVGTVIIDGNGSETVEGVADVRLFTQGNFATIVCTGSAWEMVNYKIHEYLYNSDTTTNNDTTSFAYGTAGAAMPNRTVGTAVTKRVRCKSAISAVDRLQIQVLDADASNTTKWMPLYANDEIMTTMALNGKNYGLSIGFVSASTTDIDVEFANGGYSASAAATYGANGNAWTTLFTNGYKWRLMREVIYGA